jgi:hypothetical protein
VDLTVCVYAVWAAVALEVARGAAGCCCELSRAGGAGGMQNVQHGMCPGRVCRDPAYTAGSNLTTPLHPSLGCWSYFLLAGPAERATHGPC